MKRKLMTVTMMALLSLSLFACGSSNAGAGGRPGKAAGTFSQLFTGNKVNVWYSCETIDKEDTPSVYVMYGDGTYLKVGEQKSKTFAELSKMTDEEIISWVEDNWNGRNKALMYYQQHKEELEEDARNSLPDSEDRDLIVTMALDDANREISGKGRGDEELAPEILNRVQDQVNATKEYIVNEVNTRLAADGGIPNPRYGFSVYTDASGNNVDTEVLALEGENRKAVTGTDKIKSGDVYDSHYSGFLTYDGDYFLMRMKGDMEFVFDEIDADGVVVDESVVFE